MSSNKPISPKIAAIPLDQIEIDPENVRTVYEPETVEQLRQALLSGIAGQEQFINPPSVYPVGKDRFRVKHGNCRVLAAQGVVDLLQVRVVEPPTTQTDKLLDQLGENLLQGGLSPMDTAQALRRLREDEELSISGIVDLLAERGIKRGKFWVNLHLGLIRLHPFVQEQVRAGQIAPRVAWLLRGLPEGEQVRWAREIIAHGLTQRIVEDRLGLRPEADEAAETSAIGRDSLDAASPEVAYLQLGERIAEAAEQEPAMRRRQPRDLDHRSGGLQRRWELIPVSLPQSASNDRTLQKLEQHEWTKQASPVERELAREFVFFGRCEPDKAMSLAERASQAAANAPSLVAAANQLAQVAEQPEVPPDSALLELLNVRVARIAKYQDVIEEPFPAVNRSSVGSGRS